MWRTIRPLLYENFLDENSFKVKGRALEIGDNEYTLKYGGDKLAQSDILH
jgi:hypothetical protein